MRAGEGGEYLDCTVARATVCHYSCLVSGLTLVRE